MTYSGYGGNSQYIDPSEYHKYTRAYIYCLNDFKESERLADYFLDRTLSIKWLGLAHGIHQVPNTYGGGAGYTRESKCKSLRW